jgi:2-polyprenyl-3-methyl-5-hydroxy-6-metoxy-1,4-benzoquinol methylase
VPFPGYRTPSTGRILETGMDDAKSVVAAGYDIVAEAYLARHGRSQVRDRWIDELIARLPVQARVLDLGCGAGVPVARRLAERGFHVLGIDISIRQIGLARINVPAAEFVRADMTAIEFAAASFDAVAAFYSFTHVPRVEHALLLQRTANWLKPGGLLVASLGSGDCADWRGNWLGVEMFFSHYDANTNERLVCDSGLKIECAELVDQDHDDARFLWVIARAP